MDRGPAGDPTERDLASSVSSILASEDSSRDGDSEGFGEEKGQKCRIIVGTGATAPAGAGGVVEITLPEIPAKKAEGLE